MNPEKCLQYCLIVTLRKYNRVATPPRISSNLEFEIPPKISSNLLKKCKLSRKPQISLNSKNRKFRFGNLTVK